MVSAVSSQAATLNTLAYTALDGDDAKQPASNATANDSDRGTATQVSLSQDALNGLLAAFKQSSYATQQTMDAVAVDIEHILERVRIGRIEEADHVNKILEVGVERIGDDQIVPTWKN